MIIIIFDPWTRLWFSLIPRGQARWKICTRCHCKGIDQSLWIEFLLLYLPILGLLIQVFPGQTADRNQRLLGRQGILFTTSQGLEFFFHHAFRRSCSYFCIVLVLLDQDLCLCKNSAQTIKMTDEWWTFVLSVKNHSIALLFEPALWS